MKRLIPFLILTMFFASCEKKTNKAVVGITVTNKAGIPIQNCNVKLQIPDGSEEEWGVDHFISTTDIDGYVEFNNTVNAYFDVYVWKGLWEGCDFVEFEPGETNNKSIIIHPPYTPFNGCF